MSRISLRAFLGALLAGGHALGLHQAAPKEEPVADYRPARNGEARPRAHNPNSGVRSAQRAAAKRRNVRARSPMARK